jgi:hypothetical protein
LEDVLRNKIGAILAKQKIESKHLKGSTCAWHFWYNIKLNTGKIVKITVFDDESWTEAQKQTEFNVDIVANKR